MEISEKLTASPPQILVAELFCGIGGFRIACDRLGVRTVWANDNYAAACAVYRGQFGEAELVEGDLVALVDQVPNHDLLTAGFPCQPFSQAGKKEGVRDPRGTLFNSIVEVLKQKRPQYFVLENVKRLLSMESGEHFATILEALSALDYFIEWRLINAMHLGLPQNRQRTFITGRRIDTTAPFRPTAQDVRLLGQTELEALPSSVQKLLSAPKQWTPLQVHGRRFASWGLAFHGRFVAHDYEDFADKSRVVPLREVLESQVGEEFDLTESTLKRLKDSLVINRFVQGVEILSNQAGGARMGYTVFGISGVAPTLTASTSRHYERYRVASRYRRLTPNEYARIQGFPDDHCQAVNQYVQYELYGNAVPPVMAGWAIRKVLAPSNASVVGDLNRQADLFANAV